MQKTKISILYDIKLQHPYYFNKACRALKIIPTTACKRLLSDYGLQFKAYKGGAIILREQMKSGANWVWRKPVTSINPIKFVFLIVENQDMTTFEKATFLDDLLPDTNIAGIKGKSIYYFDNLDNTSAEIRRSASEIELSDDNAMVSKRDRIWLVGESLSMTPTLSSQVKITFKKVKDSPNSERELVQINMIQGIAKTFSLNTLYRNLVNQGVTDEDKKIYPIMPSGLLDLDMGGGNKAKLYYDDTLLFQKIWGIIDIFENNAMSVNPTKFSLSFSKKMSVIYKEKTQYPDF